MFLFLCLHCHLWLLPVLPCLGCINLIALLDIEFHYRLIPWHHQQLFTYTHSLTSSTIMKLKNVCIRQLVFFAISIVVSGVGIIAASLEFHYLKDITSTYVIQHRSKKSTVVRMLLNKNEQLLVFLYINRKIFPMGLLIYPPFLFNPKVQVFNRGLRLHNGRIPPPYFNFNHQDFLLERRPDWFWEKTTKWHNLNM